MRISSTESCSRRARGSRGGRIEHREPAFIRENGLADPRFKYVAELAEERFQSLVSVPIVAKDGSAIGAVTLHTEAPREFTQPEVDFLVSSASLVGGAIENARLYEETRRRVGELEQLTRLGDTIARAETLDMLLPEIARYGVELLSPRPAISTYSMPALRSSSFVPRLPEEQTHAKP